MVYNRPIDRKYFKIFTLLVNTKTIDIKFIG